MFLRFRGVEGTDPETVPVPSPLLAFFRPFLMRRIRSLIALAVGTSRPSLAVSYIC